MKKRKDDTTSDLLRAKGFFRLKIVEDENGETKVKGDSGWRANQIVDLGFRDYLAATLGAVSGSKQVTYACIGTGTAPATSDTSLNGEITDAASCRCAVTPTTISNKTVQFAFTLNSNVITAAKTIQNVGLINHSSTATAGTIMAGNTYTTSALATNQSVNGTYQIRFS